MRLKAQQVVVFSNFRFASTPIHTSPPSGGPNAADFIAPRLTGEDSFRILYGLRPKPMEFIPHAGKNERFRLTGGIRSRMIQRLPRAVS